MKFFLAMTVCVPRGTCDADEPMLTPSLILACAAAVAATVQLPSVLVFDGTQRLDLLSLVQGDRPVALWLFNGAPNSTSPTSDPFFTGASFPSTVRTPQNRGATAFLTYTGPLYSRGAPRYAEPVGPTFTGLVDAGVRLTGSGAFLEAPYAPLLNPSSASDFTLETWVRWMGGADEVQYLASSTFACDGPCSPAGYALWFQLSTRVITVV